MSGTTPIPDDYISGTVTSGQTITGETVQFDQTLDVLSGGEIIQTYVEDMTVVSIESGAVAIGTTLGAYGRGDSAFFVYAGATATQTAIFGFGDSEVVDGGVVSGATFQSPSGSELQLIENGGAAYNTDLVGETEANGPLVQDVYAASTAEITTIGSYNVQTVFAGGTALDTTVEALGTENVLSGGFAIDTAVYAGGTMFLDGEATETQIYGGTEDIESSNTGGDTAFVGSGGTIDLGGGTDFTGTTIYGFQTLGNQIDLLGVPYSLGGAASLNAHNLLTVTEGTVTETIQFNPSQNFSADTFNLAPLASGGVEITLVPCFAAGTRILTPRGDIAVEALKVGDDVITAAGNDAAITWTGMRKLDLSRHPMPEKAQPILFEADCFADGVPSRDLILSPDHALYIDGHLVPAKALLNDRNIRQLNRATVTYHHIELAEHAIIFAENTAAESYLETGNRGAFRNAPSALTLHPDLSENASYQAMREQNGCAPFTETGPVVAAARMRTLQQFTTSASADRRRYGR